MTTTEKIRMWFYDCRAKFNQDPATVPISRPEMMEIITDFHPRMRQTGYGRNQIFGIDTEETPWAEEMRQNILDFGVERFALDQRIDERQFRIQEHMDHVRLQMIKRLTAYILTDITHLDVSFDWDRLAWLKRKVSWIGRKWPVKRKTVRIEGKVLYPYLKIQAPADTHRVRFAIRP